ncbi:hypothetical protein C0J52_09331 [Blattella germanica]|nr:hypothetical protein C0J52_09331 [Blattella germanica]
MENPQTGPQHRIHVGIMNTRLSIIRKTTLVNTWLKLAAVRSNPELTAADEWLHIKDSLEQSSIEQALPVTSVAKLAPQQGGGREYAKALSYVGNRYHCR